MNKGKKESAREGCYKSFAGSSQGEWFRLTLVNECYGSSYCC